MTIFKDAHTYKLSVTLTGNYSIKSKYPVQWIEHSLTNECPNHSIVCHIIFSWIKFSLTQLFGLRWQGQTILMTPILSDKLKRLMSYLKQYENNKYILIYCILNAELNIILLHWNKQHFESGILKWGCCLLNKNFHLVLMFTCFRSVQICRGLNIELSGLLLGTWLTSTCLRSRHPHVVESYTRIMVFWTFFRLLPRHFGDWHPRLDRCYRSE